MRAARLTFVAVLPVLVTGGLAACGGDDGGGAGSADGVPRFVAGYAATCTDGAAFGGAPAYEPGAGALPVAFLMDFDDAGTFFVFDPGIGEELAAPELADPDDQGEQARLGAISAVACLDVGEAADSGATCDFEDDDGAVTTLAIQDVTWTLTVHEARTGEEIGTEELTVAGADAVGPAVMSIDDGQTTYLPDPEPDALAAALEAAVGAG